MTCSGCKANKERVAWGYSWVSEKVSPMYKCTCTKKELLFDEVKDYLFFILFIPIAFVLIIGFILLMPFFWLSDKIEEQAIKESYDYE